MKSAHLVIQKPIITEKSTFAMENDGYVFRVADDANRIDVKRAVEEIFDVKVKKVNTLRCAGKRKRVGKSIGMTRGYKKAIVTLMPGHKIDVF